MKNKTERRKNPRVFLRALVDYESQDTFLYDYSKDLSQGGLFIKTDKPRSIGDEIELKFSLPDIEKVFKTKGEVKWVIRDKSDNTMNGMGIEFKGLEEEDKRLINRTLKGQ